MGLTPEQIATISGQQSKGLEQQVQLAQLPLEQEIKKANLAIALRKEPTIPVKTAYGTFNVTPAQALSYENAGKDNVRADQALKLQQIIAEGSLELKKQAAADRLTNATTRAEAADAKKELEKAKFAETKQKNNDSERDKLLKHIEIVGKNSKLPLSPVATSINNAPPEVMSDVVYTNSAGDALTFDPSILKDNKGNTYTKERLAQMAKNKKVGMSTVIKEIVHAQEALQPGFDESFKSLGKSLRNETYSWSSPVK